jgi:hypothetical protein
VSLPKPGSIAWRRLMGRRRAELERRFPGGYLTPHFRYQDFATHDGTPIPPAASAGLHALCIAYLEPMRARFGGCVVTSGYRHRAYNAQIGGELNSQHVWDDTPASVAADVRFPKGGPREWAAMARELRRKAGGDGGIGTYVRQGFVHLDNRPYGADWVDPRD